MTIINSMLTDAAVVIFTDTRRIVSTRDQPRTPAGFVSKIMVQPHLQAAFATTGRHAIARDLHEALQLSGVGSFDEAADALPEMLAASHARLYARLEASGFADPDEAAQTVVFFGGFSRRRQRPRLVRYAADSEFAPVELLPGVYAQPAGTEPIPVKAATLAQMIATADVQRRILIRDAAKAGNPEGYGVGGELIATEITADGIRIKTVHRWPDAPDAA